MHPKSLVCATAEPGSFYYWAVTRQARNTVPADYKWKMTPVPTDQPLMFSDKFDYPIRPTHVLQLDFALARLNPRLIIHGVNDYHTRRGY